MGRKLTTSEETRLLQDIIRQAHEATKALNAAIKQANALHPTLTAQLEAHVNQEMKSLSDHVKTEQAKAVRYLNESVTYARDQITRQMIASELQLDLDAGVARLIFPHPLFDDQVSTPTHPDNPRENPS